MDYPTPHQLARFWSNVTFTGICWNYSSKRQSKTYSRVVCGKERVYAHHFVWRMTGQVIPTRANGLTIDHLCRNIHCVNPTHMEMVPIAENVKRGFLGGLRETCKRGHAINSENVIVRDVKLANGKMSSVRVCRPCSAIRRAKSTALANARQNIGIKTCMRGHELTEENRVGKFGKCRICAYARERRYRAEKGITLPDDSPKARPTRRLQWDHVLSQSPQPTAASLQKQKIFER